MGRLLLRLLLAASVAALSVLIVEGALSFAGGRSLRTLLHGDLPQFRTLAARETGGGPRGVNGTGTAGTAGEPGSTGGASGDGSGAGEASLPSHVFDLHPDPAVGRTLRRAAHFELHGAPVDTDDLGLRRRTAGSRGGNALRVVLLGDSVAFGWGLPAEQTIAEVLERLLAEHRGPDARPVEVQAVAVPGWNTRNAAAFLFDHWDRLAPDVVLFMPVGNDLTDAICAVDSGFGPIQLPDLVSPDPWFHVGYNGAFFESLFERRRSGELRLTLRDAGTVALESDIGPESRRRFGAAATTLLDLQRQLAARHGKLWLLPYNEDHYSWLLQDHLLATGADIPVLPLFSSLTRDDVLPTDQHPNARSTAAMAGWIADALVAAGDVPGPIALPLPVPPGDVATRRAAAHGAAEVRSRAEAVRSDFREKLRPEVNLQTGAGCLQVYGALDSQWRVGSRLLVLLPRAGGRLRIAVEPLDERPDLYPLAVAVEVNGAMLGTLTIHDVGSPVDPEALREQPDWGRQEAQFDLPDLAGATAFDVKLVPERYGVVPDGERWSEVSFRLLSIGCVER